MQIFSFNRIKAVQAAHIQERESERCIERDRDYKDDNKDNTAQEFDFSYIFLVWHDHFMVWYFTYNTTVTKTN